MKTRGGVGIWIHIFLTLALVGGEWLASRPCSFIPAERDPGTHWIAGCMGPTAGLDDVEKRKFLTLPGLELPPSGRPASRQSLYRLRYSGSLAVRTIFANLIECFFKKLKLVLC
jgi:hypothetical protein